MLVSSDIFKDTNTKCVCKPFGGFKLSFNPQNLVWSFLEHV